MLLTEIKQYFRIKLPRPLPKVMAMNELICITPVINTWYSKVNSITGYSDRDDNSE
jgi:hypothetical protein